MNRKPYCPFPKSQCGGGCRICMGDVMPRPQEPQDVRTRLGEAIAVLALRIIVKLRLGGEYQAAIKDTLNKIDNDRRAR